MPPPLIHRNSNSLKIDHEGEGGALLLWPHREPSRSSGPELADLWGSLSRTLSEGRQSVCQSGFRFKTLCPWAIRLIAIYY